MGASRRPKAGRIRAIMNKPHAPTRTDSAIGSVRPVEGYAGDVSPEMAYQWWQSGQAVLVDVRSDAEREWVGFVPGAAVCAWKQWPGMAINAAYDDQIRALVPPGKKAVLLCRSGVRSIAAARRATERSTFSRVLKATLTSRRTAGTWAAGAFAVFPGARAEPPAADCWRQYRSCFFIPPIHQGSLPYGCPSVRSDCH